MIKVSPKELTEKPAMIRKAAKEGLLLLVVTDEAEVRNQVAGEVCRYVAQIAGYASPQWRGRIGALWQRICDEEPFMGLLLPGPKCRKCTSMHKYNVMRIIGVLREQGVYDEAVTCVQLCRTLEYGDEPDAPYDSSYRSYICKGLDDSKLLNQLLKMIRS